MAARADADIPADEPIHSGNEVKHLRLGLPEADEAVADSTDAAREHCVHCHLLWDHIKLDRDLVLSERHVDEDVSDEDQHYAKHCKWQSLRVVVEVLGDVHVIKSDQSIEVFLLDLHMAELANLHH